MGHAPDGAAVRRSLEPRHRPVVTWALTIAIVAAFIAQSTSPELVERFAIIPEAVRAGEWWRVVTGAFLHANLIHLAGNAYFGWAIGSRVERHIGAWRMLLITVVAMISSGVAVAYLSDAVTVGFSGVLYGWLACWLAFHLTPRFPGLRLSGPQRTAYLQLLGANVLLSLLPGISFLGHLGGFVAGFVVALALGQKRTQ